MQVPVVSLVDCTSSKTWLVTKETRMPDAKQLFADSGVNVICDGRPYLGTAIDTTSYIQDSVSKKVHV